MPAWLQSILSVLAGLVATVVGVGAGTPVAVATLLPKPPPGEKATPTPTTTYLVANILLSIAAAVLGGFVAAYLSGRSPLWHAGAVAAVFFALALVSVFQGPQPGQPSWYPLAMLVIVPVGVMAGGLLKG